MNGNEYLYESAISKKLADLAMFAAASASITIVVTGVATVLISL